MEETETNGEVRKTRLCPPQIVDIIESEDKLEILYKEIMLCSEGGFASKPFQENIFKIVYTFEEGKMQKSEPIYGKIVIPLTERYEF